MEANTRQYRNSHASLKAELEGIEVRFTELHRRRGSVRKALDALEALLGDEVPAKQAGPASTGDCPADLAKVSATQRLVLVMETDTGRQWTVDELHASSFLERRTDVKSSLDRLLKRGRVTKADDGTWGLVAD